MNREVEEAIDAMTPAELAMLEGELDKRAADSEYARLFAMGQKMAQDAVAEYKKTGSLTPVMKLAEAVATGKTAEAAAPVSELDAELDKLSAEELAQLEADLDKEAQENLSKQYAAEYFKIGQELAREYVKGEGEKTAGRVAGGMFNQLGRMFAVSARKNPIATAAGTALVGAPLVRAAGRVMTGDSR